MPPAHGRGERLPRRRAARRRLRRAAARCAAATSSWPRRPASTCRPRRPPGGCAPAEQQKVEILRALSRDAELIVMDEPTAALGAEETAQLHEIVRSLAARRAHGAARLALPARGARARRRGHGPARRARRAHRARRRGDRGLAHPRDARPPARRPPSRPSAPAPADAPAVLTVRDLHAPRVEGVSLTVRAGEIVGPRRARRRRAHRARARDLRRRAPDRGLGRAGGAATSCRAARGRGCARAWR